MTARIRAKHAKRGAPRSARYLVISLGLIFLFIGLFFGIRSAYRSISWRQTSVTVLGITEKKAECTKTSSRARKKRRKKYPCIKFTAQAKLSVQGTTYDLTFPAGSRREEETSGPIFQIGATVPILYNPKDPNFYERLESRRFIPAILFSLLGSGLAFLGFKIKDKRDSETPVAKPYPFEKD